MESQSIDGSCPISGFIPVAEFGDAQQAELSLSINDEIRQQGNTRDMITPILPLICYISRFFTLRPGDIILTGTPQGVGPMASGDMLKNWPEWQDVEHPCTLNICRLGLLLGRQNLHLLAKASITTRSFNTIFIHYTGYRYVTTSFLATKNTR
uniref:Fumarylacetoacetase-like C-terminal domain-containing protein n=1 Tax=Yersinia enterocolitica W22703 TaxID=913028 RepID=F4N671_YEREN|nr:hypothetical protein YEW_EH18210 [Yersinia enterocolitica W22703]